MGVDQRAERRESPTESLSDSLLWVPFVLFVPFALGRVEAEDKREGHPVMIGLLFSTIHTEDEKI
jgi:hypothetical protein